MELFPYLCHPENLGTKVMSQYGPALFIKRKDKKEIEEKEQDMLLNLVTEISEKLKIQDDESNIVSPEFYDYDEYEEKSVAFLMYSSSVWGEMPEDIQEDQEKADKKEMLKIGKEIDQKFPNTYAYKCYYVED